jgi:hypothetical protein
MSFLTAISVVLAGVGLVFLAWILFRRSGVKFQDLLKSASVWRASLYLRPPGVALWVVGCVVALVGCVLLIVWSAT